MADRLIEEPKALENKIRGRLMSKGNDDPKSSRTGEQQLKYMAEASNHRPKTTPQLVSVVK